MTGNLSAPAAKELFSTRANTSASSVPKFKFVDSALKGLTMSSTNLYFAKGLIKIGNQHFMKELIRHALPKKRANNSTIKSSAVSRRKTSLQRIINFCCTYKISRPITICLCSSFVLSHFKKSLKTPKVITN